MASIQKLKSSLQTSTNWGITFKQQIKQMLEEITLKNHQVYRFYDQTNKMKDENKKMQSQYKSLLEQKQRMVYKIQKLNIQLDRSISRIEVYEESLNKKIQWNNQLNNKLLSLQIDIQKQKNHHEQQSFYNKIEQFNQGQTLMNSIYSNDTDFKEKSIKSVFLSSKSMVDDNLLRIELLSKEYKKYLSKMKTKQYQLQRLKKDECSMRQKIKAMAFDSHQNDENKQNCRNYNINKPFGEDNYQINSQTRLKLAKIRELQQKNEALKTNIREIYDWVSKLASSIQEMVQYQKIGQNIQKQMLNAEREIKKQKATNDKISQYLIHQ